MLKLREGNHCDSINITDVVAKYFSRISYDYNPNVSLEAFKIVYDTGHLDIVKNVYSTIFNVGYKDLSGEQLQYLKDMFLYLISIRSKNEEWANNIIIENILAARPLKISRQIFPEIRTIVEQDDYKDTNIADVLSNKIRWASPNDKKSIKALLKSISDKDFRMMLYNKIVLYKSNNIPTREELKSAMNEITSKIIKTKNWEDYIDILLRGGRKGDANCLWFGYGVSQQYDKCEELISRCLDLYKIIPLDDQSYGFFMGLSHIYI